MAQEQNPNSQHSDFYASRRESENNAADQGGHVSAMQIDENREAVGRALEEEEQPTQKVTAEPSGAKRGGYFRKRDYEP